MATTHQDLLAGVGDEVVEALLALGDTVHLAAGEELFALGGEASAVYLLDRGQIALTLPMHVGGRDQDILVEERTPGQMLGWSGLIAPHRFTLKATAQVESDLLALPRALLLRHFDRNPETGYRVMQNVASVVGQRLQVFQAMWLREMQRVVELRAS